MSAVTASFCEGLCEKAPDDFRKESASGRRPAQATDRRRCQSKSFSNAALWRSAPSTRNTA